MPHSYRLTRLETQATHKNLGGSDIIQKHAELLQLISSSYSSHAAISVLVGEPLELIDPIVVSAVIYRMAFTRNTLTGEVTDSRKFDKLLARAETFLLSGEMPKRNIANIIWAIATARREAPQLQRLIASVADAIRLSRSGPKDDTWSEQALSNTIWAIATLRVYLPELSGNSLLAQCLPELAEAVVDAIDDFNAQAIANVLWAIAQLRQDAPYLMDLVPTMLDRYKIIVSGEVTDTSYTTIQKVRMMWSLALLNLSDTSLITVLADDLAEFMEVNKPEDFRSSIDALCALAKLALHHDRLAAAVAASSLHLPQLRDWDVAALAWSFDLLDSRSKFPKFKKSLLTECLRRGLTKDRVIQSQFGYEVWDQSPQKTSEV